MPNFASIQHSLYHAGQAPTELELDWDAQAFGKVSNIAFDQRGKYAALYCDRSRVTVCTAQNMLIPQTILTLPEEIKGKGYYCSFLMWSHDAQYLFGNFYKRPPRNYFKKLLEPNNNTTKSILLVWKVAQQSLISNTAVSFLILAGFPLVNIGPYRTINQVFLNHMFFQMIPLDYSDQFRQFAFYTIETGLLYPVDELYETDCLTWKLSSTVYSIPVDRGFTNTSQNQQISSYSSIQSLKVNENVREKDKQERKFANVKKVDFFGVSTAFTCIPFNGGSGSGSYHLITIEDNFSAAVSDSLSVHQFDYSSGADGLLTVTFQRIQSISLKEPILAVLSPTARHHLITKIEFSPDNHYFYLQIEQCGLLLYSFEPLLPSTTTVANPEPISFLCDYSYDHKLYQYYGIHFLNSQILRQVVCSEDSDPPPDLLLLMAFQKIERQSRMMIWDYREDINRFNKDISVYNSEEGEEEKLSRQYSMTSHSFPQTFVKSYMQMIPTIYYEKTQYRRTVPLLFGVDSSKKLWSCSSLLQSNFAGAMFPIGYKIIHQIQTYTEKEDELDYVVQSNTPSSSTAKAVNESNAVEMKVSTINNKNETFDWTVVQSPVEPLPDQYLQQLPFDLNVTLLDISDTRAAIVIDANEIGEEEEDLDEMEVAIDDEGKGTREEEEDGSPRKRKKSSIFPTSLDYYLPVPNRVITGDFVNKLNRERQQTVAIAQLNQNPLYIQHRYQQIQLEAMKNTIKSTLAGIRKRRLAEEKREKREQNKKSVLATLLKGYEDNQKKVQIEKQIQKEVSYVMFGMIVRIEKMWQVEQARLESLAQSNASAEIADQSKDSSDRDICADVLSQIIRQIEDAAVNAAINSHQSSIVCIK